MAIARLVPRNQVQSIDSVISKVAAGLISSNTGVYTVPTAKIARVTSITFLHEVVGSDSTAGIAIKRGASFFAVGAMVAVNGSSSLIGVLTLQAADIITYIGDSGGTNHQGSMSTTIKEFDA